MRRRGRDVPPSQEKPGTRAIMVQPACESREGGAHDSGVIGGFGCVESLLCFGFLASYLLVSFLRNPDGMRACMLKFLATSCARKRIPTLLPCTRPLERMSFCIEDTLIEANQARIAENEIEILQGLCRPETLHAVRIRSVGVAHVHGVVTSGLSVLPRRLPPWKSERQSKSFAFVQSSCTISPGQTHHMPLMNAKARTPES
jgi:hypothetical protein